MESASRTEKRNKGARPSDRKSEDKKNRFQNLGGLRFEAREGSGLGSFSSWARSWWSRGWKTAPGSLKRPSEARGNRVRRGPPPPKKQTVTQNWCPRKAARAANQMLIHCAGASPCARRCAVQAPPQKGPRKARRRPPRRPPERPTTFQFVFSGGSRRPTERRTRIWFVDLASRRPAKR